MNGDKMNPEVEIKFLTESYVEKFSNIFEAHIGLGYSKVLEERKGVEKTKEKILSLINAEEEDIKSSGDSNDELDLGSLVSDFYERYQDLYSRYDNLISKLQKNFHSYRETGSSSFDITHSDTGRSDLKIQGSSYSDIDFEPYKVLEENKGIEKTMQKILRLIIAKEKVKKSSGDSNDHESNRASLVSDFYERYQALYSRYEVLIWMLEAIFHSKRETEEDVDSQTLQGQLASMQIRNDEPVMQTKSEQLSTTEDLIKELTKKALSLERSQAFYITQLQACTQVMACEMENTFESEFIRLCKNIVISLQNINGIIDNRLFMGNRLFEDQFLEMCKNVVFSLEKIKVSDLQNETIRVLQKACQDHKIEISRLEESHKEMLEKIEACEAKKEGDDKKIKELRGQVQTLEDELFSCNQRLKNTEAEYEAKEGEHRSLEYYLRKKSEHLEAQRSEILRKGMKKIKDLLSVGIVDTLGGIFDRMDSAVKEKCGHIQTKLSKLFEELQRVKRRSAALGYEKQEHGEKVRRMLEKCGHIQNKLSKSCEEIQRVKKRRPAAEKQELDQEAKGMREDMEKRLREKEEEERLLVREEVGELRKRLAEKEEEGRRMQEEMEEVRKRSVRENERELETKELVERLREVEERMREHEEGGRRMERRAAHVMMALEEMEKSIDFKTVESRLLQEEMEERERKLGEKEEEMEERERKLGEKEEEMEERERMKRRRCWLHF